MMNFYINSPLAKIYEFYTTNLKFYKDFRFDKFCDLHSDRTNFTCEIENNIVGCMSTLTFNLPFGTAAQAIDSLTDPRYGGQGIFSGCVNFFEANTKVDLVFGFPNRQAKYVWYDKFDWINLGDLFFIFRFRNFFASVKNVNDKYLISIKPTHFGSTKVISLKSNPNMPLFIVKNFLFFKYLLDYRTPGSAESFDCNIDDMLKLSSSLFVISLPDLTKSRLVLKPGFYRLPWFIKKPKSTVGYKWLRPKKNDDFSILLTFRNWQ